MSRYKLDVDKIRMLALQKSMSLSDLCLAAGISRSSIHGWGNRCVYPSTLFKIAKALDVNPIEIIEEE